MTITIKSTPVKPTPITFPRVMKYSTPAQPNGARVLFFDYRNGVVLESSAYSIGSFRNDWSYCEGDMDWVHVPKQEITIVTD